MSDGHERLMSGATPIPRLDERYELADRTGHSMGVIPFQTLAAMVRQGRLFRTDVVSKNGGPHQPLGELPEFADVFEAVLPKAFAVDGQALRPTPELSGEFDTLAMAGLLGRLYRKRSTGRLFVTDPEGNEKVVVFQQGVPVNATSNITEEWLGEFLMNHGLIDQEAYDQAVEAKVVHGARLGSALIHLEKLSPRELHRALSLQAMERILNLFRTNGGRFQFVPDESALEEDILLMASPRDLIETGLAAALPAQEATRILRSYGDTGLAAEIPEALAQDLSETDRSILEAVGSGLSMTEAIPQVSGLARLTTAEARVRLLTLMRFGVLNAGDEATRELEGRLQELQTLDHFLALDARRAADADAIRAAFDARCVELGALPQETDTEAAATLRERILAHLEEARDTLADDTLRPMYERALQLGLDFKQPEVRRRLEHEALIASGRAHLGAQEYSEARAAFIAASEKMPEDPEIYVHIAWAQFLGSDHGSNSVDMREAEDNLRRAIELDPRNNEAQSELRLLFSRELDAKRGLPSLTVSLGGDLGKIVALSALVIAGLFAGANLMGGGADTWPDLSEKRAAQAEGDGAEWKLDQARKQNLRHGYAEDDILAAATELGLGTAESFLEEARKRQSARDRELDKQAAEARQQGKEGVAKGIEDLKDVDPVTAKHIALEKLEAVPYEQLKKALSASRRIPADQQVQGNTEYYYFPDDHWWWTRRIALLMLGILGVLLINREKFGELPFMGDKPALVAVALVYGVVVGVMSQIDTATPMGALVGMGVFHAFAEQVFFIWFVGRGLLKDSQNPVGAVAMTAFIYTAYQFTYFAVLHSTGPTMALDVARAGAFVGGASAALLWQSGGLMAPLLGQVAIGIAMAVISGLPTG